MDSRRRAHVTTLIRDLHRICADISDLVSREEDPRIFDTMQQAVELLVSAIMSLQDAIETGQG